MLTIISPAKTLDYESPLPTAEFSQPALLDKSAPLVQILKQMSPQELASLMRISDKLATLNAARYGEWDAEFTPENARQALFAFKGDVYEGLDAYSMDDFELGFAQQHLAILSGLYGVLKPLDLMRPYRLEMGTKLRNPAGNDLYSYWGDTINEQIRAALDAQGDNLLINLASNEYFKSVRVKTLGAQIYTPVFKDLKNGQYKVISFYAKKARGMMARYIIDNRLESIEQLKQFDLAGYHFSDIDSTRFQLVFKRENPA